MHLMKYLNNVIKRETLFYEHINNETLSAKQIS